MGSLRQKIVLHVQKRPTYRLIPALDDARVTLSDLKQKFHKHILRTKPKKMRGLPRLTFEVTNICNARCTFCAYRYSKDKKEVMPFAVFKEGIDQFVALGGEEIVLTPVVGDPLIDQGLFEKIAYAQAKGIRSIHLYTNGILLNTNENYKKLVDSGIRQLDLSIGEFEQANYTQVYGVQDAVYRQMRIGVHNLLKYNRERGEPLRIIIGFRPMSKPGKVLSSPDFKKYVQPYLSDKTTVNVLQVFDNFGGMITPADMKGVMRLKKPYSTKHYPCIRLYNAISILPRGDVRLCGCRLRTSQYDDLVVGNIFKEPLATIYKGKKAERIRQEFAKHKYPDVCKECTFYEPNL